MSQGTAAHTSSTQTSFAGCDACHNSGFKGRAPVMSHLLVDNVVKAQIESNPSVIKVENEMLEEAKDLYGQGKIPFFEVAKVS
jgi:type II secretory ATPase GspE/PulE/Tfp pilus assembly ATPase PilB-like protein